MKSTVMYDVAREFLMILSDIFFDKLFEMYESMWFVSVGLPRTVCALERIEMHQP